MASLRERYPYTRDPNIFPPIKAEHAQAIGYVAAHWSFVDEQLTTILNFLLSLPPVVGAALTAEVSGVAKLLMIRALIELGNDDELLAEWDALILENNNLRSKRNDAVHAVWRVVEPSHYAKRVKAKSKLRYEFGPVDTKVLTKLSEDILELADKMVSFTSGVIFSKVPKNLQNHHMQVAALIPSLGLPEKVQAQAKKAVQPRKPSKAQRRKAALGRASGA